MVSRNSKIPLYHQLYEGLRSQILSGELEPGDMLPTENELLDRHGISRNTVRQALDLLVNDGLIVRERGRGTFVAQPKIDQGLTRIISFTEDMLRRGLKPDTRVLLRTLMPAPEHIAEALGLPVGEELAHLERLRLADGEPMSIEKSYLVHRYCPGVLERDYSSVPLRETLAREYNIFLVHGKQRISAIAAPADTAAHLDIAPGAPLLYIERTTYTARETAVEYLQIYNRGDRYTLHNELYDETF